MEKVVKFLYEDKRIEPGHRIFPDAKAADKGPVYSTSGAAKFFGWTASYIRHLDIEGTISLSREPGSRRTFNLADLEDLSYQLVESDLLDHEKHRNVLNAIYSLARVWRIV